MSATANDRLCGGPSREETVVRETPGEPRWKIRGGWLDLGRSPHVMGVVNVTPDSFSDGGKHFDAGRAVDHGLKLVDDGADLLDVGGESTRPGAVPVPLDEELRRVIPVIERLADQVTVPISIDTYKAETARRALGAGAAIINDITGLAGDPEMTSVVAELQAGVICMHMQGTPQTMQTDPRYHDVVGEVTAFLMQRIAALTAGGVAPECIAVDPGICFGKRRRHNLELLRRVDRLVALGRPVCIGVSRKGFLDKILGRGEKEDLVHGTIGTVLSVCRRGVQIVRVHDVRAVKNALAAFRAVEPERA